MGLFGLSGLKRVKVSGNSMEPTFNEGDVLLVKWFSQVPQQLALLSVVVIERDEMPGVFFIKRIQKSHNGLYWVTGDNPKEELEPLMNDSRKWGYLPANEIKAKVLFRINKG